MRILANNQTAFIYLNDNTYIPIQDHQGNLVSLLNLQGDPIETYRYTPFGEPLTNSNLSPWRFASKRYDPETHLIYFGRRYYNPTLGRFITPDPIGFTDGPNLYAYVHNRPLTCSDYNGLFSASSFYSGLHDFGSGMVEYGWDMAQGIAHTAIGIRDWMVADNLYEDGDPTLFNEKSEALLNNCKELAQQICEEPLFIGEMLFPGVAEAIHNPTSAHAWGKATLDVALIALSGAKLASIAKASKVTEEVTAMRNVGKTFPKRALPRDKYGNPVPECLSSHTQLGMKKGRNYTYPQAREFGPYGNLIKDIDFTDHGRANHPNPHQHLYQPNATGGTPKRGPAQPFYF